MATIVYDQNYWAPYYSTELACKSGKPWTTGDDGRVNCKSRLISLQLLHLCGSVSQVGLSHLLARGFACAQGTLSRKIFSWQCFCWWGFSPLETTDEILPMAKIPCPRVIGGPSFQMVSCVWKEFVCELLSWILVSLAFLCQQKNAQHSVILLLTSIIYK